MSAAAETTTTITHEQYADWLAGRLIVAGIRAKAWHGNRVHRVYIGEDKGGERPYVQVTDGTIQNYGHAVTALPSWYKSPSVVRALVLAGEDVLTIDATEIGVRGEVALVQREPASDGPGAFGSQFGRCAECGGPTRNGCHRLVRDSSGLHGWCCSTCAAAPASRRSFA